MPAIVGSSPHTRGAPFGMNYSRMEGGIIPAYAGSTTGTQARRCSRTDHPRIRGEHVPVQCELGDRAWIIPAYAGSTPPSRRRLRRRRDHPRIRGEHVVHRSSFLSSSGSSPHTRGAHWTRWGIRVGARIIPAYAGSTPGCATGPTSRRDHPRIRGEHTGRDGVYAWAPASSPHTRGAHRGVRPVRRLGGIIPAYAGSTLLPTTCRSGTRDHPRIRGEHFCRRRRVCRWRGSSPHTRGAPAAPAGSGGRCGIIPAYAGSTWRHTGTPPRRRDHPRIRGEHATMLSSSSSSSGSSPHTRGAHPTF